LPPFSAWGESFKIKSPPELPVGQLDFALLLQLNLIHPAGSRVAPMVAVLIKIKIAIDTRRERIME
jgi:hypothetical protein